MLCIPTLSAQSKGDKYVGGIIGITTTSISIDGSSASQTTFGFAPEFGYFASDKLRIGGSIGYQLISANGETTHGLTAGPSLAYYVRLCDRFYYTPQLAVGFAFASTDGTSGYGFDARVVARSVRNQAVIPYRIVDRSPDIGLQLSVVFGNGCERGLFPARNQPDGRFQILLLDRKNPIPAYRNRTPLTRARLRPGASRSTIPVTTSAASCQRLARNRRR